MPALRTDVACDSGIIGSFVGTVTRGGCIPVVVSAIGVPSDVISIAIITLSKVTVKAVTIVLDLVISG